MTVAVARAAPNDPAAIPSFYSGGLAEHIVTDGVKMTFSDPAEHIVTDGVKTTFSDPPPPIKNLESSSCKSLGTAFRQYAAPGI